MSDAAPITRDQLIDAVLVGPTTAFTNRPASAFWPFDNASPEEPVAFLACYLLAPGEDRLMEML